MGTRRNRPQGNTALWHSKLLTFTERINKKRAKATGVCFMRDKKDKSVVELKGGRELQSQIVQAFEQLQEIG